MHFKTLGDMFILAIPVAEQERQCHRGHLYA
jgi:hypothetical protein